MKVIIRVSVLTGIGLLPVFTLPANKPVDKPNVLFILADDLGYHDMSCMGSKFYETPNIDKIAGQGMVFTNGYAACQVCSPSRASIMSGKFPARHGITDWIGAASGEKWRNEKRFTQLLPPEYVHRLPSEYVTLPEALKEAGYRTFFAGKWHLGEKGSWPEDHGFEINIGGWDAGSPRGGYFSPYENPNLPDGKDGENLSMRLALETVRFLKENNPKQTGKPVFAYLSFYEVHGPIETTQEKWSRYRQKAENSGVAPSGFTMGHFLPIRQVQDNPVYAGLVEQMDDAVGLILNALKDLGLNDNTIVIFTSDNGGVAAGDAFATSNLPLRAGKGYQFEGGIREPSSIIRKGDWKLIHYYEDGRDELYNLRTDLSETSDVSGNNQKLVLQLHEELFEYLAAVGAVFPEKDPEYSAEAERKYLEGIVKNKLPQLEKQRLNFLSKDFDPKNNWWGSKVTVVSAFSQNKAINDMRGETAVSVDAIKAGRGKLFDEGNFGMFIHWGLFSHLGGKWQGKTYYGIGEWIMNKNMAGIPVADYKKVAGEFNPSKFDAGAIARLAKDAGMKYIIITGKHHEGFAMFHSRTDSFNIVDATPFARDPMKELSAACREQGLGFGFYYSHNQDWTAPGGSGGPKENADGTPAGFDDYFYRKCLPQVREICSNYGSIDFVWFDTPGNMKKELVVELVKMVRGLQPNAMLCSRVGHGMGDYASKGDMEVPPLNIPGLWETCDTNNDSWSYAWYDTNFKSPKEILNRLISTVARGGTYLFNVGPDGQGQIPEIGAKFLRDAGNWIQKYPQVVYGAGSSPWGHAMPWGDITTKGKSLFLSVFEWPQDGKLYLPGLKKEILSARLLKGTKTEKISFENKQGWTIFKVPYQPGDVPASVIELSFKSTPEPADVDPTPGLSPNAEARLLTVFADVKGAESNPISWMEKFGEWKHVTQISKWTEGSSAGWTLDVFQPGYYYIDLFYKGKGKLVWNISTDEGIVVQNQQAATEKYRDYPMGILEFKNAGKHTLKVSLVEGDPETSSLESLRIYPVK